MASTTRTQAAAEQQPITAVGTASFRRRRVRLNPFRLLVYTVLTLGAIVFVWPFLWMVSTSLQSTGDIVRGRLLPSGAFLNLYRVEADLNRTLTEYLRGDELPPYLEDVRPQIESSRRQQGIAARVPAHPEDRLCRADAGHRPARVGGAQPLRGGRRAAHYIEAWTSPTSHATSSTASRSPR